MNHGTIRLEGAQGPAKNLVQQENSMREDDKNESLSFRV